MGMAKRLQIEGWEKDAVASRLAIQAKVLGVCPMHEDQVISNGEFDYAEAYKLGNHAMSHDDPMVELFDGNRRDLTDRIKEVCDTAPDRCPICAHYAAKD